MPDEEAKLAAARQTMVDRDLRARGITDPAVLRAFAEVPREPFVPPERWASAYDDNPLPIGHGQTISQPYVVALTLQEADLAPEQCVLDVGAGSGYQTALLAKLVRHVYAVERIEQLARRASETLAALGLANVTIRAADGSLGWPEDAPFDRIVSGAASPDVPPAWIEQLVDGGKIILPVGELDDQVLLAVQKDGQRILRRELCRVRFVKLIGRQGWPEE
jgi:protein-L-isoaspartate(D-aspartate) O-methyltransferase